jgi:long-chain acyl-CoA synthetase
VTVVEAIRRQAALRPEQPALVVDDGAGGSIRVRYAELVKRADAHAAWLRAEGVLPGDRCGLVAPQGRGFVELALGILAARACLVPVPDEGTGPVFDAFATRARLHHVVRAGDAEASLHSFADVAAVDGAGDADFRALRPAYLRFTSGTTSERKGVVLGQDAILARLDAANRALCIGPEDRVLWVLPMAHHFVVSILLYLRSGARVLLPSGSLARTLLAFAQKERATVLYASPHHYESLSKDTSGLTLPSLRLAISTADGLRRETALRFRERFGIAVAQALGIIEVGLPVANLEHAADAPEALGRPLPDYEIWLRGDDGQPAPGDAPERCGEICIRGPGMLDAYLDPWLPARELLEPDGFRTGDQGWWDDRGLLHLSGRRANRISMAGMKFFSEEVEEVLDAHPGVRESRVRPRAHAHLGQIPVADVVPQHPERPPGKAELIAHCRQRLPAYKVPRSFEMVDQLPRTDSGKVRRE